MDDAMIELSDFSDANIYETRYGVMIIRDRDCEGGIELSDRGAEQLRAWLNRWHKEKEEKS